MMQSPQPLDSAVLYHDVEPPHVSQINFDYALYPSSILLLIVRKMCTVVGIFYNFGPRFGYCEQEQG